MVESTPVYQQPAGKIINDLTGDISYQVVSEQGAMMEVKVFLNQKKYEEYQQLRTRNQKLVICIDKSGSMSGSPMEIVKKQCLKVGEAYFNLRQSNNANLVTIPFESRIEILKADNFNTFLQQIQSIQAGGGTNFSPSLDYISNQIVRAENCKQLLVFFLTDGDDGNSQSTINSAERLKQDLMRYEVQSRFCVIGVGQSYDAVFLDRMSTIGNEQGFVMQIQPQDQMTAGSNQAADFAEKALKNLDVTEGIYIPVGDQQVFVPLVGSERDKAVFKIETFIPKKQMADIETKLPLLKNLFASKDLRVNALPTISEPTPRQKIIILTQKIQSLDLSQQVPQLKQEIEDVKQQIDQIHKDNQDAVAQVNVSSVQDLVNTMATAVGSTSGNRNDTMKVLSQLKSKIVKKQQNIRCQMKVKADMTPKNPPEGKSFDECQEIGIKNNATYLRLQLVNAKARKVTLASIGNNALTNMQKICEEFKSMIESNPKQNSLFKVHIKPVKSQVTDIEDLKNPGKRIHSTVHTMSVSLSNKTQVNHPAYEFNHKTDVGSVGQKISEDDIVQKLKMFHDRQGVASTRIVYSNNEARQKIDTAIVKFSQMGTLFSQNEVQMMEKGRPVTVRIINFLMKSLQVGEEKKSDRISKPYSGKGKQEPIENLPLFVYNRATDKNVGKETTSDEIVKILREFKTRSFNTIRYKFIPKFAQDKIDVATQEFQNYHNCSYTDTEMKEPRQKSPGEFERFMVRTFDLS